MIKDEDVEEEDPVPLGTPRRLTMKVVIHQVAYSPSGTRSVLGHRQRHDAMDQHVLQSERFHASTHDSERTNEPILPHTVRRSSRVPSQLSPPFYVRSD